MAKDNRSPEAERHAAKMSRRKLLGITASGSAVLLAGCSGNGNGTPSDGSDGSGGDGSGGDGSGGGSQDTATAGSQLMDPAFTDGAHRPFSNLNFNYAHSGGYDVIPATAIFTWPAYLLGGSQEIKTTCIEDIETSEETVRLHIDDSYTWHNGKPVTARDFEVQWILDKNLGHALWDYTEGVNVVDDTTFEFKLKDPVRQDIFLMTMQRGYSMLKTPRFTFGEYADSLSDASSDEETNEALNELNSFQWDDPVGAGPFKFDGVNGQTLVLQKYEDHSIADKINFDRLEYINQESDQQVQADIRNNNIDARYGASTTVAQTIRKNEPEGWELRTNKRPSGPTTAFNFNHDTWGIRNARKAIACLVRPKLLQRSATGKQRVVQHGTTLLPEQLYGKFDVGEWAEDYGFDEVKSERAAELLRDADFTKEDGKWYTPSGDRMVMNTLVGAPFSDWIKAIQTYNSTLNDFGIKANLKTYEGSGYWGDIYEGKMEVCSTPWNFSNFPNAIMALGTGLNFTPGKDYWGYPEEVSLPEVGDVGGKETLTINVEEKYRELSQPTSEEEYLQGIKELAWMHNQLVPRIPYYEFNDTLPVYTKEWDVPDNDDPVWSSYRPINWLHHTGGIQAKIK